MAEPEPRFDAKKVRATIEKGRRDKWWTRKGRSAKSFRYFDAAKQQILDDEIVGRIRSLAIPPAWKFVRICPSPSGKLQAVGMDKSGRIQYLYHPKFAAKQQALKFSKVRRFGESLPKLLQAANEDIARDGLQKEKVLAVVMRLINSLYFRVGTDLSVREYKTFGITTLLKRHLTIGRNGKLEFAFTGKSHIFHRKVLVDAGLAKIIKNISVLGRGKKLFHFVDEDGKARPVTPAQINAYLKSAMGSEFSAKDFRTWGATVLTAVEFASRGPCETEAESKKVIVRVVSRVARELGNTPAVCRGSYIHPAVISAYTDGTTIDKFRPRRTRKISRNAPDLEPEEKALLKLLASCG